MKSKMAHHREKMVQLMYVHVIGIGGQKKGWASVVLVRGDNKMV